VCRLALHHMQDPAQVVREMARVCRVGGTVLVEDIRASEHPERAAYQDRWEKLRDPSHVRTLPVSELLHLLRNAGLEVDCVASYDDVCPDVERWLATTQAPAEKAAEVRRLLEEDRLRDLSGTRPFLDANGQLHFHARGAILTGRRFRPLP
jgi:SAM-dependent methyltransferase